MFVWPPLDANLIENLRSYKTIKLEYVLRQQLQRIRKIWRKSSSNDCTDKLIQSMPRNIQGIINNRVVSTS